MATSSYLARPWRQGRHNKNLIYVVVGSVPSNDDPLIIIAAGSEHVAEIVAFTVVEEHNQGLERGERE